MIVGIVPARMGSSRFPGKPLHPILGRPLLEHCYKRARLWSQWDELFVATPDREIADWCRGESIPFVVTEKSAAGRALDACAEATERADAETMVVCVQGDEPLVTPENIAAIVRVPVNVTCNVLAVPLRPGDRGDPNTVKILARDDGWIMYTTRQPVPGARARIGGLLAMKRSVLGHFAKLEPSHNEMAESCDLNRLLDNHYCPAEVDAPSPPYQSVDCLEDVSRVESMLPGDPWWGKY